MAGYKRIFDGLTSSQRWYRKNKEKRRPSNRANAAVYYERTRTAALSRLGSKCANRECRWLNLDGTLGCTDTELLQVDHINGGGKKELSKIRTIGVYRKVLKLEHPEVEYQLLCPNCNWLKRGKNNECPGAPRKYQD
jgi:hypothetical protein